MSLRAATAFALAGTLKHPSIAIASTNDQQDPVGARMQKVLMDHKEKFVTGHFVNAHSVLYFGGSTDDLNQLLNDLATIDGTELTVRFSKSRGAAQALLAQEETKLACQWEIDHNTWTSPNALTVTIHLGDGKIDLERLALPTLLGRAKRP